MASYLTPIQVSVRTGIAKSTLAKWRKDGKGRIFVKRGGRPEYPSRELQIWLQAGVENKPPANNGDQGKDSAPIRTGVGEQCPERARLLREWTQCGRQLTNVLDEQLAALKNTDQRSIDLDEEISMVKRAENGACRAYYDHLDSHDCV